jgi:hypothetical protein
MATKQQAADAAYERAEAQRALVMVLACAERTHEQGIAEAAALLRKHYLKVSEPTKVKTLAGQIDLVDGSVEGAPHDPEPVEHGPLRGVPSACPGCGAAMLVVYGGSWTPLIGHASDNRLGLQCAFCAWIVSVNEAEWDAVREERRRTIGATDRAPVKVERAGKKTRGAE